MSIPVDFNPAKLVAGHGEPLPAPFTPEQEARIREIVREEMLEQQLAGEDPAFQAKMRRALVAVDAQPRSVDDLIQEYVDQVSAPPSGTPSRVVRASAPGGGHHDR